VVGRIVSLLILAVVAGAAANSFATVSDETELLRARVPPIPAVDLVAGTRCPIPPHLRAQFVEASSDTGLPLALLTAVGQVGAPSTAPASVPGGARYLRAQIDRFGSSDLGLAAYAQGPDLIEANGGPSGEMLTYVADVRAVWRGLAGCG
jgi:hypothetical protein